MEKLPELETRELTETVERIDGVVVGMLFAISEIGEPRVMFSGNPDNGPAAALTTIAMAQEDIGKEVALMFENGDPARPMIIGRLVRPDRAVVEVDGRKQSLDLEAQRQITLKCGKASITLTADGKVLIRGTYLSSRSSGANRIKGGSVHLN